MALRRFRGATTSSTVAFTGQAFNRELLDTGTANGSNGSSVVLAAGASASFYLTTATGIPNLAVGVTGSWEAAINFQGFAPTNIFCKFRVHRISVSGTTPTILASTAYSAEVQARAINTAYIANTDGTDLGTFASGNRIAIEWTLRNAGAASLSPQPAFGTYASFVRTPIESSTAVGWTGTIGRAAYRPISYSEGTIKGVKRTGFVRNSITSTGTATGVQGGQDFSGSVTGVSTSSGTIAAGLQGYGGTIAGLSNSNGTIAAGLQGYEGSSTGSSTSSGTVNGSPGPVPDTGGAVPQWWYTEQERQPQPEPLQVLALTGAIQAKALYATGRVRGRVGYIGSAIGTNRVESFITAARVGYSGSVPPSTVGVRGRVLRGRSFTTDEMLILMGEL